jgi:hypothetical protein
MDTLLVDVGGSAADLAVSRELTGRERLGGQTFAGSIERPVSRDVIVSGYKALFAYLITRFDLPASIG